MVEGELALENGRVTLLTFRELLARLNPDVPRQPQHVVWRFALLLNTGSPLINLGGRSKFSWGQLTTIFEYKGTSDGFRKLNLRRKESH